MARTKLTPEDIARIDTKAARQKVEALGAVIDRMWFSDPHDGEKWQMMLDRAAALMNEIGLELRLIGGVKRDG